MLSEAAMRWLDDRGLDVEMASRLGLETVSRGAGEWVALPYLREGARVNRKYRRLDEKAHGQDKGAVKCVWNEDCLRDKTLTGTVIITEGEWDAIAALQAGFSRVVSVPDGAPAEAIGEAETAKYSYLEDLIDLLRDENEIILAVDSDPAGANLLADLAVRLGKARCKYVPYPKGCKDLGDALRLFGVKGVRQSIERAAFVEVTGVKKLSELTPEPALTVFRAGLSDDFDKRVGIVRGHLSVWTGIPNHGKSTVVTATTIELAKRYGWTIAMATFESSPQGPFRRDVARYLAGKPFAHLTPADMDAADEFINRHFVFLVPSLSDYLTLEWLVEKAETAVVRYGAAMLVVDPWNQLDHEFGPDNETTYTSRCIKLLQRFSRRYNVHTAVVAHPKKMDTSGREKGRVPTGYDISGSANWFNHPELGVTVHRDGDCTLVRVWKSKRHDEMGEPGDVRLRFSRGSGRFDEWFDPVEEDRLAG